MRRGVRAPGRVWACVWRVCVRARAALDDDHRVAPAACHAIPHVCQVCGLSFTALTNASTACKVHPLNTIVVCHQPPRSCLVHGLVAAAAARARASRVVTCAHRALGAPSLHPYPRRWLGRKRMPRTNTPPSSGNAVQTSRRRASTWRHSRPRTFRTTGLPGHPARAPLAAVSMFHRVLGSRRMSVRQLSPLSASASQRRRERKILPPPPLPRDPFGIRQDEVIFPGASCCLFLDSWLSQASAQGVLACGDKCHEPSSDEPCWLGSFPPYTLAHRGVCLEARWAPFSPCTLAHSGVCCTFPLFHVGRGRHSVVEGVGWYNNGQRGPHCDAPGSDTQNIPCPRDKRGGAV